MKDKKLIGGILLLCLVMLLMWIHYFMGVFFITIIPTDYYGAYMLMKFSMVISWILTSFLTFLWIDGKFFINGGSK